MFECLLAEIYHHSDKCHIIRCASGTLQTQNQSVCVFNAFYPYIWKTTWANNFVASVKEIAPSLKHKHGIWEGWHCIHHRWEPFCHMLCIMWCNLLTVQYDCWDTLKEYWCDMNTKVHERIWI